jgi:quercetin dioxygenase-like cupin family protein
LIRLITNEKEGVIVKLIKDGEGIKYDAKKHFGCYSMFKTEAGKETKKTTMVVSHFLPDGGAEMASSPKERVYMLLSGSLKVTGKNEIHELEPGDMIYIAPGEERAVSVIGTEPATILVVITDVD